MQIFIFNNHQNIFPDIKLLNIIKALNSFYFFQSLFRIYNLDCLGKYIVFFVIYFLIQISTVVFHHISFLYAFGLNVGFSIFCRTFFDFRFLHGTVRENTGCLIFRSCIFFKNNILRCTVIGWRSCQRTCGVLTNNRSRQCAILHRLHYPTDSGAGSFHEFSSVTMITPHFFQIAEHGFIDIFIGNFRIFYGGKQVCFFADLHQAFFYLLPFCRKGFFLIIFAVTACPRRLLFCHEIRLDTALPELCHGTLWYQCRTHQKTKAGCGRHICPSIASPSGGGVLGGFVFCFLIIFFRFWISFHFNWLCFFFKLFRFRCLHSF